MGRPRFLYKVTQPRPGMVFRTRRFWRTKDFRSSTTNPREGYLRDELLYANPLRDIAIHLFPKVPRIELSRRCHPTFAASLAALGITTDRWRVMICNRADRERIAAFSPTVYRFARRGFFFVPSGEGVTRRTTRAVSCCKVPAGTITGRWGFHLHYVDDVWAVERSLKAAKHDLSMQT